MAVLRGVRPALLLPFAIGLLAGAPLRAQEHDHGEGHEHGDCALHFVHPLFAESISPDTKARLDFVATTPGGEKDLEAEGEYAMGCAFSAELGLHYHLAERVLGDAHLMLKAVNGSFAARGVSIGYGISLGFPARSDATDDHEGGSGEHESTYHVAPFLNAGLKRGVLELVGWTFYTVHTGSLLAERQGTSVDGSISALVFVTPRVAALLEVLAARGIGGAAERSFRVSLAPGIKLESVRALSGLGAGAGVELPVGGERAYDARLLASVFYHF